MSENMMNSNIDNHNKEEEIFYNNDSSLPAQGSKHRYTDAELKEFVKCYNDPAYFIKNYVKIINLNNGVVPFTLYPYQEKLIKQYHDNRFCLAMLGRQMGKCCKNTTKIKIRGKDKKEFEITCEDFYKWLKSKEVLNISKKFIDKKFIDSIEIEDFEILTDTGWKPVTAIYKTISYQVYELRTESGKILKCADTHIIFDEHYNNLFVKDCLGKRIITIDGIETVTDLIKHDEYENMYDLTVNSDEHRFWSDGILSHNTSTAAAYFLWCILFNSNYNIGCMANKMFMAKEILSKIKDMYVWLPRFLKVPVSKWNMESIQLVNGSRIITAATSVSAFRGSSLNILYGDEFAFVPPNIQQDFMASVYPTISSGKNTKIIFTTTPNGMSGEFYKLWVDATEGRNRYNALKFIWSAVPDRDDKWRDETIANIGETRFNVEYNCEFMGSSNTLISPDHLKRLRWADPIITDKDLRIYKKPEDGRVYFMSVDVGQGKSLDYSTFTIFDITDKNHVEQVAVYRNNEIEPSVYPTIIAQSASYYNDAFVLVENNDAGILVADILFNDLEIENLLFTRRESSKGGIATGQYRLAFTGTPGVKTTKSVKTTGCISLKQLIESGNLILHDKDTISELMVFIDKDQKGIFAAEQGEHDDLVMNCVLFSWAMNEKFFKSLMDFNFRMDLYKTKIEETESRYNFSGFLVQCGNISDNDTFIQNGVVWNIVKDNTF